MPIILPRRLAAGGVATLLATGALVTVTTGTAQAASTTYTCTIPGLGEVEVPLDATAPDLPAEASTGDEFAAGLPVDLVATIPASVAGVLGSLGGLTGLTSDDFAFGLAGGAIPVEGIAMGLPVPGTDGALDVPLSGTTGGFSAPVDAGSYPITMPSQFSMLATTPSLPEIDITCITEAPATIITMVVGDEPSGPKADSTTVARAKNSPLVKGRAARIVVRVTAADRTPTGKVVLKRGRRTVAKGMLNDRGRVRLRTRRLHLGKNRLVAKYRGDEFTQRSRDRVIVRVKRRRR